MFGVWSANASVGNIIGAFLVSELNMWDLSYMQYINDTQAASVLHYGYQVSLQYACVYTLLCIGSQ